MEIMQVGEGDGHRVLLRICATVEEAPEGFGDRAVGGQFCHGCRLEVWADANPPLRPAEDVEARFLCTICAFLNPTLTIEVTRMWAQICSNDGWGTL